MVVQASSVLLPPLYLDFQAFFINSVSLVHGRYHHFEILSVKYLFSSMLMLTISECSDIYLWSTVTMVTIYCS